MRCGTCNVFLAYEQLPRRRFVDILETKSKRDWACFLKTIADEYKNAQLITLVMDNLNTRGPGALYETYPPVKAKALWD
jgi:PhoPQ-activated pathogenicity-related protein